MQNFLDLINRLQAENERLKEKLDTVKQMINDTIPLVEEDIKTAKAEAYKEFVERLRHIIMWSPKNHISITAKDIDNLLKEMVGE